jgi:ATP-binding cassette subfamily B (MDR/TAP) protein 1
MAVTQIGRIATPIIAMARAATAATELLGTIDAKVPDLRGLKSPEASAESDIVFEDVTFAYPSRADVTVLDHLNVKFESAKVTAIVGPSGSGKSTIVGLLERWYELRSDETLPMDIESPEAKDTAAGTEETPMSNEATTIAIGGTPSSVIGGSVSVGGINICDLDCKWWRSKIGLVQQEPFLFNDTIFRNVAYGLCGTEWQDAPDEQKMKMVKAACDEAYANEFICRLPQVCIVHIWAGERGKSDAYLW